MHNLWDALPGNIDDQICVLWGLKPLIHPNKTFDDPLPSSIVNTATVGVLAMLKRGGNVDQEKITTRASLASDRLAYGLASCLLRRNR